MDIPFITDLLKKIMKTFNLRIIIENSEDIQ